MSEPQVCASVLRVVCGDFRTVDLGGLRPTAIVGNPPFKMRLVDDFLRRAHELLPDNGRCGLLLGTQMFQTPSTVLRWAEQWSIDQRLVPRTLFPRVDRAMVFVMFTKEHARRLFGGFLLYHEAEQVSKMCRGAKLLLVHGRPRKSCWRAVVEWALRRLGGQADLPALYDQIYPRRPTSNPWWREKVRQTLQREFRQIRHGVWALPAAA